MDTIMTKDEMESLGFETLNACPDDETKAFIDGYLEYTSSLFGNLKCLIGLIVNEDESSYIDMEYQYEVVHRFMEYDSLLIPLEQRVDFWRGAMLAEVVSKRVITFAVEIHPTNKAA